MKLCENPLVATLRDLFGYTEGEFCMANAPNQHIFWTVEGNQGAQRKPMQIWGEHANSAQTVIQAGNRILLPGAVRQQC